jgi:hypothetical protein
MRAGKLFPRPARVSVRFGKPVQPGAMTYEEIAAKLRENVVALLEDHRT